MGLPVSKRSRKQNCLGAGHSENRIDSFICFHATFPILLSPFSLFYSTIPFPCSLHFSRPPFSPAVDTRLGYPFFVPHFFSLLYLLEELACNQLKAPYLTGVGSATLCHIYTPLNFLQ